MKNKIGLYLKKSTIKNLKLGKKQEEERSDYWLGFIRCNERKNSTWLQEKELKENFAVRFQSMQRSCGFVTHFY